MSASRYELHAGQQPPYGYFGPNVIGESARFVALLDPRGRLAALHERLPAYPDALRRAVVQDGLWAVQFGQLFAEKFAARADPYGVTGCLARGLHRLVLVLFAWNRAYPLSDKTALDEIADFPDAPGEFPARARALLAQPGGSAEALASSVAALAALCEEVISLCGALYRAPHPVPR